MLEFKMFEQRRQAFALTLRRTISRLRDPIRLGNAVPDRIAIR